MDFDRNAVFSSPQQEPVPGYPSYPGQGMPPPPLPPVPPGTSYGRCVAAALVWVGATLVLLFAKAGPPASGRAAGYVLGTLLLPCLATALVTWLFVRRKRPAFWLLVLASLPTFAITFLVFGAARLVNA